MLYFDALKRLLIYLGDAIERQSKRLEVMIEEYSQ